MNTNPKLSNLKPWKKGISGNPKGRPKKIYNVLNEKGYSKDDIRIAINELVFYSLNELETLKSDKNNPAIVTLIANVILKAYKNGDYRIIKDLIEQIIGKTPLIETNTQTQSKLIEVVIID